MSIDLEAIRDEHINVSRVGTHFEDCWRVHRPCAIALLADEVERLRAERDEAVRQRNNLAENFATLTLHAVKLRDGIREIAGMHDGHDSECARCQAAALLDSDGVSEPEVQTACDRCTQGVMDADNPHLTGACRCLCHAESL